MYFLSKMGIFHCYVSLPEGTTLGTTKLLVLECCFLRGDWTSLHEWDIQPMKPFSFTSLNHGQLLGWDMDIPFFTDGEQSPTRMFQTLLTCHIHLLVYFWMSTWLWLGVAWFHVNSCSTSVWLFVVYFHKILRFCDFQPHLFEDNELWAKNNHLP